MEDKKQAFKVMDMKKLEKLIDKEGLTEKEVMTLIKSGKNNEPRQAEYLPVGGKSFSYGYFSDSHIGHHKFLENLWDKLVRMTKKNKPDFMLNIGDTLEGMSNRAGHVYELSEIGFGQQMDKAEGLIGQLTAPVYSIDGNHDGWFKIGQNMGVIVGQELEKRLDNYKHLGEMEGDLNVEGINIKLFHGNDGTAYATSYKLQKLIESFSGGEKPHIVHSGHYHKALYMFNRNVHGFESGTLCGQSKFMRGRKIPAHTGFGFVTVYHNKKGVDRLVHEFVPYYER